MSPQTFHDFGVEVPHGRSGEIDVLCPKCSSQRKKKNARCLSVNIDKGCWFCNHCGWSGGLTEGERRFDPAWRKPAFVRPTPRLVNRNREMEEWFATRGISLAVLERNRISWHSVYMPQVEEHVNAVAFPYYRDGEYINTKYRDLAKNFRMETGAERVLYGLDDIDVERCIIVEGEMDKLSLEVAGLFSCISVPDGAPAENAKNYASKFTFLEADHEKLDAVTEWIIAVDNDGPGKRLEDELSRRLGPEKCKRVTWPGDCKDANDVLRSHGAEVLRECIDHAELFPLAGVFSVSDFSDKIDYLYEHGWERGSSTGWEELDQFYTVRPGEMSVVTGIPNSGKSNWVDALLVNLAGLHGWHFALFSPENQPLEDHMGRMCEKYAMAPFGANGRSRMDRQMLVTAKEWVRTHFTWILPADDAEWTVETVLDRAKALVMRKGIRGLVIDPWNELEHEFPNNTTETVYTGKELRRIRQFARRHGVHVWIVAHPQKMYRDRDSGNYPVPTLYDISGSANFRNKADNGLVVWRDFSDIHAPIEVHVQKIRFRQIGRVGMVKVAYEHATATYRELGFEDPRNRAGSAALNRRKAE